MQKNITFVVALIVLLSLTLYGCASPTSQVTEAPISTEEATPTDATVSTDEVTPTDTAASASPTPAVLTLETIKNVEYKLNAVDNPRIIRLVDGIFTDEDRTEVRLFDQIAIKDLNGDGVEDAAVLVGENFGGSGTFVSLVVFLSQNGQPEQFAAILIDDRPKITSLTIEDGQIVLEALVHGVDDPMCCPTFPITRTYGLGTNGLVLTNQTSQTPGGAERIITIEQPLAGSDVSGSVQVKGTVTISPFENNLVYAIYNEKGEDLIRGPFPVQSEDLGGPGTFDNPIDLGDIPIGSVIRLELSELSMADGSLLAMDSVGLKVK